MKSRAFNKLLIDVKNNTLIKSSTATTKLKDEINYYLNIPTDIKSFFPSLLHYDEDYSSYQIELIPYKNLAEQILTNEIDYEEGKVIVSNLLKILDKIHSYKNINHNGMSLNEFCIEKTLSRVDELNKNEFFNSFFKSNHVYVNDEPFTNFPKLKNKFITAFLNAAINDNHSTMMHGDFCFSNILYCPKTKDIKLIDPRGAFHSSGIYGHPLYDYAKLLHCLHGEYDYITSHDFILHEKDECRFYLNIKSSSLLKKLYVYFLQLLRFRKINLDYLFLVEASLFLSMASLHYENLERQKVLFLKGLIILNDILKENNYPTKEVKNAYMY